MILDIIDIIYKRTILEQVVSSASQNNMGKIPATGVTK